MAGNRFRGELVMDLDGRKYTLRLDMNTLAAFEAETGKPALDWAQAAEVGGATVGELIAFVRCALARHHAGAADELAGDLLSEDPALLGRLFEVASPQVDPAAGSAAGNGPGAPIARP